MQLIVNCMKLSESIETTVGRDLLLLPEKYNFGPKRLDLIL